jgi:DNA-binding PadR family transcriptional regulator
MEKKWINGCLRAKGGQGKRMTFTDTEKGNERLGMTYQEFGTRHRKVNSTLAATGAALLSSPWRAVMLAKRASRFCQKHLCLLAAATSSFILGS